MNQLSSYTQSIVLYTNDKDEYILTHGKSLFCALKGIGGVQDQNIRFTGNSLLWFSYNVKGGFAKSAKCIRNPILKKNTNVYTQFSHEKCISSLNFATNGLKIGLCGIILG